jgi:hypothetical protein
MNKERVAQIDGPRLAGREAFSPIVGQAEFDSGQFAQGQPVISGWSEDAGNVVM